MPDQEQERAEATKAIISSVAARRLIIAGPGTGKTFTFREALRAAGGGGLALTFIRLLVADLQKALAADADAMTLHGFCFQRLHQWSPIGLTSRFSFYPRLMMLLHHDLRVLNFPEPDVLRLEAAMQEAETSRVITEALALGAYYDTTSFVDVVYRAHRFLTLHPAETPTYSLIVVDEYQDFTYLETLLIEDLARESRTLIAGDDDQSLYSFRPATPQFIRDLANSRTYERFPLPFCSRSPQVIVDAVCKVIEKATEAGLVTGRLEKRYECYLPEKAEDSERYPRILDVRCSVQNARYPFMSKYIDREIRLISEADIEESHRKGFPTVLVIGPGEFLGQVQKQLVEAYGHTQTIRRRRRGDKISILDGYRYLAEDDSSNLGWRIVIEVDPPDGADMILEAALSSRSPLRRYLDDAYVANHLPQVETVGNLVDGLEIESPRIQSLEKFTGLQLSEIQRLLSIVAAADQPLDEDASGEIDGAQPADHRLPSIVCTSLVGAKGLSAQHVFVVGMNESYFPRIAGKPTTDEAAQLLVALSRTRKQCHLLSAKVWTGKEVLRPSSFLGWLEGLTRLKTVDAAAIRTWT